MKTTFLFTLAMISIASAQDPGAGHGRGPQHRPPVPPFLKALDTDGDHTLSAAEIDAAPEALLTLDTNGDGQLDREDLPEEAKERMEKRKNKRSAQERRQGPPKPAIIRVLDPNDDRVISAEEIENASSALLTLDKDENGTLTPEELMPNRPGKGARRGPGGPPPEE